MQLSGSLSSSASMYAPSLPSENWTLARMVCRAEAKPIPQEAPELEARDVDLAGSREQRHDPRPFGRQGHAMRIGQRFDLCIERRVIEEGLGDLTRQPAALRYTGAQSRLHPAQIVKADLLQEAAHGHGTHGQALGDRCRGLERELLQVLQKEGRQPLLRGGEFLPVLLDDALDGEHGGAGEM